jgi:hypothetical protein
MTMGNPASAAPVAKEAQYLAAMKVEPSAPVMMGNRDLVADWAPNRVSRVTLGKMQSSALVDRSLARPWAP